MTLPDPNPSERLAEIEARANQIVGGKVTLPSDDVRWLLEQVREAREDKLLPRVVMENVVPEIEAAMRVLDWIGVARGEGLTLAERVRILAIELATKQGYTHDEATELCRAALTDSSRTHQDSKLADSEEAG